jgi:hypothetical protein
MVTDAAVPGKLNIRTRYGRNPVENFPVFPSRLFIPAPHAVCISLGTPPPPTAPSSVVEPKSPPSYNRNPHSVGQPHLRKHYGFGFFAGHPPWSRSTGRQPLAPVLSTPSQP